MIARYTLKEREIPLNEDYEVIVIGGGPAGCTAATSSAREGKKTLLVEATGCLGGMGTSGLVPAWCPFSDKIQIIYKGLAERVFNAVKKTMPHVPDDKVDWVPIDPEQLKVVYDDMVSEADADVLFNTVLSGVDTDGKSRVTAVILSNKDGLCAYKAKIFIDCTGDGDLAVWAGADYEKGDSEGDLQAASLCFILSNVDSYGYLYGESLHAGNKKSPIYQIVKEGKYPLIIDYHMCNNFIGPSTVGFNAGHLYDIDNTDPRNVSKGMMKGRKLARQIRDALAEYAPQAFANSFLVQTAALMGTRETRRIICDYVITEQDYRDRRSFPDEICRNCYYMDVHAKKGMKEDVKKGELTDDPHYRPYGPGDSHGVPYRALVPKKLDNVLIAGRCVSSDHIVNGSLRVMPVCLSMGEAVGTAAAMAVDAGSTRAIDVQALREKLLNYGAYLK